VATAPSDIRTVHVHAATRRHGPAAHSSHTYPAHVGHDLLTRGVPHSDGTRASLGHAIIAAAHAINLTPPRRALIVHDDALPAALIAIVANALRDAGLDVATAALHADEDAKSLSSVERLLAHAIAAKLERTDCFVALGGGITGDLTGFAASIYRRGVAWCNIPTTLLAMVDASIGGKTGCNLTASGSLLKNMAGAFHDPALVLCDTASLATLPPRELVGGLAECVKHAMIERSVPAPAPAPNLAAAPPTSLWSRLEALAAEMAVSPINPASLVDLIADNLALKARVVAADPFETASDADGGRALLNLGHTFGHALETMTGLAPRSLAAPTTSAITHATPTHGLSHGEAVALGLVAASVAGTRLGTCSAELTPRVERLLTNLRLPTRVEDLSLRIDDALARLRHDKKSRAGSVRIIVPVADTSQNPPKIGLSRAFSNPTEDALRAAFEHLAT
jgi:3-dehydroquinate synthetase